MTLEYKRNYDHSYMIMEDEENKTNYEEKMLLYNRIRSLLMLEIMTSDDKKQYWYDITGKESLRTYLDYERLSFEEMETLFTYLSYAVGEAEEYLLNPGHIMLSVDEIFFDRNTKIPTFAYFPFEDTSFQDGIRNLVEELLRTMNHEDAVFVSAMYEIYEKVLGDNFSIEELIEIIRSKKPNVCENKYMDSNLDLQSVGHEMEENGVKESSKNDFGILANEDSDFDFNLKKPKNFFSFSKKRKEKNGNRFFNHSRKKDYDDVAIYVEEEIPEEKNETVLLSGTFTSAGHILKYTGANNLSDFSITGNSLLIGSVTERNDIVINSPAVSKRHARITQNSGNLFLEDLNSTNGTYVNGDPLTYQEKRLLKKNDKIHFADEMYVLE